jgi:hypothetical protein
MEVFDESVGCGMVGGCPGKLNSTQFGQGVDELTLVRSRMPHLMFMVVLERDAACTWYGMKSSAISTGWRSGRFVLVALT